MRNMRSGRFAVATTSFAGRLAELCGSDRQRFVYRRVSRDRHPHIDIHLVRETKRGIDTCPSRPDGNIMHTDPCSIGSISYPRI